MTSSTWVANVNSSGWSGLTLRQIIPTSALLAGSRIRLTVRSGTAGDANIGAMYIGAQGGGDAYDFAGTPTQVLFSGASGVVVPQLSEVVSDQVVFAVSGSSPLVIATYFNSTTYIGARAAITGWSGYYKSGNDTTTVDATGYLATANQAHMFVKIEVFQP